MHRLSFRKKVSEAPTSPTSHMAGLREAPPHPGQESWVVNDELLKEKAKLIPTDPSLVPADVKERFLKLTFNGGDAEWRDLDFTQHGLGVALGVFPEDSDFQHVKWIFWTENVVNAGLSDLVLALAAPESKCLQSRTTPEFQFSPIYHL